MDATMIRKLGTLYCDMTRILEIIRPNQYSYLTAQSMIDLASRQPILGIVEVVICLAKNDIFTNRLSTATMAILAQLDPADAVIVLSREQQNEWLAGYHNGIQPKQNPHCT